MTNFLGFVHGVVLGGFSIYGAGLLGRWVLGRGWHWAVKFIALVFVASLVVSGLSLMVGGAPDDLRIFTELLASAGAIIAAANLISGRGVRNNPWIQFGIPGALLLFLAWTWREQIQDLRHGTLAPPTITAPPTPPAPVAASDQPQKQTRKELCDADKVDYSTCHAWGYK